MVCVLADNMIDKSLGISEKCLSEDKVFKNRKTFSETKKSVMNFHIITNCLYGSEC